MSRRPAVLDLVILTAIALILRSLAAALVSWPAYTDPAYYDLVAQRLATGHGFTVPVIWSFLEVGGRLPDPAVLPVPSNAHWMPLTSLVPAAFMALLGTDYWVAQLPMVALSTALVALTYVVGWRFWHSRRVAVGGSVLAIFAGPLLVMYPQVANFAVFGVPGAVAILASCLAVESRRPSGWLLLAGMAAGFATLGRVDGVLLTTAPATAWIVILRRAGAGRSMRALGSATAAVAAYGAVVGPWLLRNVAVFGAPLPSAGGHTLWITNYNEQFSIGHAVSFDRYLAAGPGVLIGSRLVAIVELAGRTTVLLGGVFVIFFAFGLLRSARRPELLPFVATFCVVFGAMALLFTFHAPRGAYYHAAPAWLPFALPMAVAAVPDACNALARWWRFLGRRRTQAFLTVAGLAGAVILSLVGSLSIYAGWREDRAVDQAAGALLARLGDPDAVVMSDDPAALWQVSGHPGVPIPADPYPVIETAIRAYGVEWLVVTRRHGEATDPLGLWEGAESVDDQGNGAGFLASQPTFETPDVRVYRVR